MLEYQRNMINKQSETPALAEGGASPQPDRIMKTTSKHLRLLAAVALAAAWGFVGNATAAFSPPDIADCSLWLDGSDVDGNGVPDTYTDGQAIGTWVDKSGLGNNFANSSASQPVFKAGLVNGLNGLFFNGSYLSKLGGVMAEGDDDYEYVFVWRPHISSGGQRVFEQTAPGVVSRTAALLAWDNHYGLNGEGNDRHDLVPFAANAWILTDMKVDNALNPGNVNIKHNGVGYVGTTGNPGALNVGAVNCQIGRKWNNGEFLNGDIAEMIIYKRALTGEERNQVGYYLQQKYGFSFGYTDPVVLHFVQEPASVVANAGEALSLSGSAAGGDPIGYQWYKNSALLDGATGQTLDWPSLQTPDAGSYFLVASNASMMITSQVARVVVRTPADGGLLARWTFEDGTARDVYGVMDGTLLGGATISNGRLQLNGTDAYLSTQPLPVNVSEKTLVAWVSLANLTQRGGGVMNLQTGDGNVFDAIVYGEREAGKWMSGSDGWSHTQNVGGPAETAPPEETVLMAIVYKSDNSITLYRNGEPYGSSYVQGLLRTYSAGNGKVLMGCRHQAPSGDRMLAGQVDEARLYDRALTVAELLALTGSPLYIWGQPQNQFAFIGETATFTVGAGGDAQLSYQWLKGGEVIDGQTASNLALANVQMEAVGGYSVVVSNSSGVITSAVANLVVYHPISDNLVGLWQLDDMTGLAASDATGNNLTGTLVNFPGDDSQWSFGMINGALNLTADRRVEISDSPLFHLDSFGVAFWVQANSLGLSGSVISKESAALCETWGLELRDTGQLNFFLFNNAGFIADVQSSVNLDVGTFHHVALAYNHLTSTPDIYLDGVLVSSTRGRGPASGPPGYDNAPLTFGRRLGVCAYAQSFDGFLDDVQLYNKYLNNSEVGYLYGNPGMALNPNINLPPGITAQPQSQAVLVGSTFAFSVAAEGTIPLHYQWFHGETMLAEATGTNLTLSAVQAADAGDYTVVVSNYLGSVTSLLATLQVIELGGGAIAKWTFDDGTAKDVIGAMNGTLMGGATIANGRLLLNGIDAFVETASLGTTLTEKTFLAWVALSTLDQGGGGVITLEQGAAGAQFDSMVYAEQEAKRWMAGSDFWRRTASVGGPAETSTGGLVLIAIVYRSDNSVAIYRNGQPYGNAYTQGALQTYSAGSGRVLLGRRHTGAALLSGEIDEATLFNRALTPGEIAYLYAQRSFRWTTEPQNQFDMGGEARSLSAVATSDAAIDYQWFKNGGRLEGATDTTLNFPNLQGPDAGSYYAVASSAGLSITSKVARVVVRLPADGGLLARWTFDDGTPRDVYGLMDGALQGGATIVDGRLQLNGSDAFVRTLPLPVNVFEKTLLAWVSLANLDQGGGGAMNLQTGDGNVFDAIVFAEQEPRKWMSGSDGWNRSQSVGGPEETASPTEIVMMAIVYGADNSITLYRNGQLYGTGYAKNSLQTYLAGNGVVEMGCRHAAPCCNKMLAGQIDEARLYDRALSATEIANLAAPPSVALSITRSGESITISWPPEAVGYELQSSKTLPATSWDPVPGVVNNSVTIANPSENEFYRLRK